MSNLRFRNTRRVFHSRIIVIFSAEIMEIIHSPLEPLGLLLRSLIVGGKVFRGTKAAESREGSTGYS